MKQGTHRFPRFAFAALLLLDITVWMIEKTGVLHAEVGHAAFMLNVVRQPLIWIAIALGPLQLWLWTRILSKGDLSLAYPLTSLSYPLTMICAQLFFHEKVDWIVWTGAVLITAGVALISTRKEGDRTQSLEHNAPFT